MFDQLNSDVQRAAVATTAPELADACYVIDGTAQVMALRQPPPDPQVAAHLTDALRLIREGATACYQALDADNPQHLEQARQTMTSATFAFDEFKAVLIAHGVQY